MTIQDENYDDNEERALTTREERQIAHRAIDWGVSGSILAIIILTGIYALSPVDAIPDFLPGAGWADDIGAIFAGGGSVIFLTIARYAMLSAIKSRAGRWGCLILIVLAGIGAFTVFWALLRLFDSLF
jgi:uncharacterized membrane protein YkvA (DUF1232 family)